MDNNLEYTQQNEQNCKTALNDVERKNGENDILENFDVYPDPQESFCNGYPQSVWTVYDVDAMSQHDFSSFESAILQFCIQYLPLRKHYSGQFREYIRLAQEEIFNANYGNAISRYKDFLRFVDNFAVSKTKSDFSTGRIIELKTLAYERLALCYLLKDNSQLALNSSHKAIIQKPVVAQTHLWRAMANRRLGHLSISLRCLTIFGTLVSVSPQDCPYHLEEQRLIALYWKMVLVRAQQAWSDVKLLHFPSYHLNRFQPKEQEERMSITFLMNYPNYNCLIHSDPYSLHLLPVGNGTFTESLLEQKQAFGFRYNQKESRYFAHLPGASYFCLNAVSNDNRNSMTLESAKQLWKTSAFINSTSSQMSLKPGKGLFEHLVYCHILLREEEFNQVMIEYECILADLALFPVLSDIEWTDDLALVVDANIEMIEIAIEALKEHNAKALETARKVEEIKQWLELSERKFRVQQRQKAEREYWASTSSSSYLFTPKRKYAALHRFLEETKTKKNLFPKNKIQKSA